MGMTTPYYVIVTLIESPERFYKWVNSKGPYHDLGDPTSETHHPLVNWMAEEINKYWFQDFSIFFTAESIEVGYGPQWYAFEAPEWMTEIINIFIDWGSTIIPAELLDGVENNECNT